MNGSTMTMRWVYFVLSLLLLGACSPQGRIDRALSAAEEVVERRADSALCHLYNIADDVERGDKGSRALYGLLLTEAKYRQNEDKPDSLLPVILSSEEWFRSAGDQLHLERSMYYHAMMQYNMDKHDFATLKLKEGERLAEQLGDSIFISKYYESLCMIGYSSRHYRMMLEYAKKFLVFSLYDGDVSNIARGYEHLAGAYDYLGFRDSSIHYLNKAVGFIERIDSHSSACILNNIGNALFKAGHYEDARCYLLRALSYDSIDVTFKSLGDVFFAEGETRNAMLSWEKAMNTTSPDLKLSLMESLFKYYVLVGDTNKFLSLHSHIVGMKDSLFASAEMVKIEDIQRKYDHLLLVNQYYRYALFFFVFSVLVAVLVILLFRSYRIRLKEFKSIVDRNKSVVNYLQNQVHALSSVKLDLEESKMEVDRLNKKIQEVREQSNARLMRGRGVYEEILAGGRLLQTDKENEPCFVEYYSVLHADIYAGWRHKYDKLSLRLLTYLVLEHMGYSDDEMMRILNVKYGAIRTIRMRLRKKERA